MQKKIHVDTCYDSGKNKENKIFGLQSINIFFKGNNHVKLKAE